MIIGNSEFDTQHHTYVFGILNVTPDSFSDGGKWSELDKALWHVESMINEGTAAVKQLSNGWTVTTTDGKLSAHFEHTVAITANGPVILTKC